jgi:DNA gyrase/topoisomerase IV subunit B
MKLEIEVTEAEMRDTLARYVRTAVADRVNQWGAKQEIQRIVTEQYKTIVHELVVQELRNSASIRGQVREMMIEKIKNQLNAAMRAQKPESAAIKKAEEA